MSEFSHRSLHGAKAGRRRLFAATALVLFILFLDMVSGGKVRGLVRSFSSGIWNSSQRLRASIVETGYFTSHRSLAAENASLREQLANYQEKAAGYDVLSSENSELRAALHLAENHKGLTAPVVSSFRSSPYGTFLIGAGTSDALTVGDLVITDGGFVIGTVSDIQAHTTEVKGIFSAGERTDAIVGSSAISVIGDGGGNAHAEVSRSTTVSVGDPVIAPHYGGRAIGVVGHIESSATSADQKVYIQLPVNLSVLRYVYILHG